jgi:hypothetical protein
VVTSVVHRGDSAEVQLEAVDEKGEFLNFLDANAGVVSPDKSQSVLRLQQVGPGRYRGAFPADEQGAYLVGVAERKDQKLVGSEVASLVIPYSPEHRVLQANEALLRDLVAVSGGRAPAAPADNFTQDRHRVPVWVDAWPYLLALALLLFIPDVAFRRLWRWGRQTANGGTASGSGVASVPVIGKFGARARRP